MEVKGWGLMKDIVSRDYVQFLSEIKSRIVTARIQAFRAVNKELIQLYWDVGRIIVIRQEKHGWGQSVVERLAVDLTETFKGFEGFSSNNLWRIRNFYLAYKSSPKLARLVQEIPWGQNIVILQMVKDAKEREYYIRATAQMGWSRNVLMNQIKAGAYRYQKSVPKQHNFPKALPKHFAEQADESLKSVYNLDFLLSEISTALRSKIEYFVDLLFYYRILKSLVAVELKTGKFEIEYTAKMDFYLDLLNEQVKLKDENPSIGIILCVKKDSVIVEYAMRRALNPMGVVEYRLTAHPPKELKALLPSEREMKTQLQTEFKSEK